MKYKIKEDLEDFVRALGTVIGIVIIFGIGFTILVGFVKLAIWIWSI